MEVNINVKSDELLQKIATQQLSARVSRDQDRKIESVTKTAKEKKNKDKTVDVSSRKTAGPGASLSRRSLIDDPAATGRDLPEPSLGFILTNYRHEFGAVNQYSYSDKKYQKITPFPVVGDTPTLPEYGGRWITTYDSKDNLVRVKTNIVSNYCGYLAQIERPAHNSAASLQNQGIDIFSSLNRFETYLHMKFEGKAGKSLKYQEILNEYRPYTITPYIGGSSLYTLRKNSSYIEVTSKRAHGLLPGETIRVDPDMFYYENNSMPIAKDPFLRGHLPFDPVTVQGVQGDNKFTIYGGPVFPSEFEGGSKYGPIYFIETLPDYVPQIHQVNMIFPFGSSPGQGSFIEGFAPGTLAPTCSGTNSSIVWNPIAHPSDDGFVYSDGYLIKTIPPLTSYVGSISIAISNNAIQGGYFDFKFRVSRSSEWINF